MRVVPVVQRTWGSQSRGVAAAAVWVGGALVVAGCSAAARPAPAGTTFTRTQTVTGTRAPSPAARFTPAPAASVRPLPPGTDPRPGEREQACPYLRSGLNQDSGDGVNLADLEGDRVYRTTVLTGLRPVGCRFYFYAPPYEAVADIRPQRFPTAAAAYNAMVITARTGEHEITERDFVPGLVGISFRTRYFGPDGRRDWAFVFAKGRTLVAVYTQRSDTSRNAVYVARAIAAKF